MSQAEIDDLLTSLNAMFAETLAARRAATETATAVIVRTREEIIALCREKFTTLANAIAIREQAATAQAAAQALQEIWQQVTAALPAPELAKLADQSCVSEVKIKLKKIVKLKTGKTPVVRFEPASLPLTDEQLRNFKDELNCLPTEEAGKELLTKIKSKNHLQQLANDLGIAGLGARDTKDKIIARIISATIGYRLMAQIVGGKT